jgi:murein DD-endopeptidase MepM/ murein hydrolase activator NlpD
MNIILFSRRIGRAHSLSLNHPFAIAGVATAVLGLLGVAFTVGMQLGQHNGARLAASTPGQLAKAVAMQKQEIAEMRAQVQQRVDALAVRMGQVNAHVVRLDALGKRLTQMANIDSREFNFDAAPAVGGPESEGLAAEIPDLSALISGLESRVALRDSQLAALENVILQKELRAQIMPEGRPVRSGFISSYFGERQDPFTGHQAFHKGVDFASQDGADVIAVAAGVVTYAGDKQGYGTVVEINHGDGYVTRYGHNKQNLVQVGQTVTRGERIALMGSTGRSTGPHVHFEVVRGGNQVDPLSFIGR